MGTNILKVAFGGMLLMVSTVVVAEPGDHAGDHEHAYERADWNDAGRGVAQREREADRGAGGGREWKDSYDREINQKEAQDAHDQESRERPDVEHHSSGSDERGNGMPEKEGHERDTRN